MPHHSYSDLENPGSSFVKNAANAARGAVCSLYRNYKDFYHNNGIGISTPPGRMLENFWNNVCPGEPPYQPPAPPPPPFKGGQCNAIAYAVSTRSSSTLDDGSTAVRTNVFRFLYGPIGGVRFREGARSLEIFCKGAQPNLAAAQYWLHVGGGAATDRNKQTSITEITREDGQPDTCGDPPAPPLPPPVQPPSQVNTNINFSVGGNNVTMPLTIAPQLHIGGRYGFNPDLDLNFTINADADINFAGPQFTFSPNFSLKPQLNFSFGDNGVNFNFGGPNFSFTGNIDSNPALKPEEGEEIEEKNKPGLKFVKVTLTKLPDKVQYGNGGRNVYFAGWIEFLVGDSALPRTQINFEESLFEAPEYSDGYSVTFTNGARGRVTKYTLKE